VEAIQRSEWHLGQAQLLFLLLQRKRPFGIGYLPRRNRADAVGVTAADCGGTLADGSQPGHLLAAQLGRQLYPPVLGLEQSPPACQYVFVFLSHAVRCFNNLARR